MDPGFPRVGEGATRNRGGTDILISHIFWKLHENEDNLAEVEEHVQYFLGRSSTVTDWNMYNVSPLCFCLFSTHTHTLFTHSPPTSSIISNILLKHALHFLSIPVTMIVTTTPPSLFSLLWSLTALLLKILDLVTLCRSSWLPKLLWWGAPHLSNV